MSGTADMKPDTGNPSDAMPVTVEEKTINGLSVKHAWQLRRLAIVLFALVTLVYVLKVSFFVDTVLPIQEKMAGDLVGGTIYLLITWIFGAVLDDNWRKKYLKV